MKPVANWWRYDQLKYAPPHQREIFLTYISAGKSQRLLKLGDM